ncbi:MAG TPA: hypothetical protein VFS76_15695 [Pyrinomonadaceae bacterium]|nr:hypothetical protein [Pyrinomonadaceae bacterium]
MDSQHLLVPIKVQALVVDDIVIKKRGVIELDGNRYAANDGRWSPQLFDYDELSASLTAPGPKPFYGATDNYNGHQAEQLVLNDDSPALPQNKDRGVYLHWVLPSGLRHSYTPGLLDFPALPDHWLIVRFARQGSTLKTNAWFVDGGALATDAGPANLLFAESDEYVAKRAGKVVPLDQFASANSGAERTPVPITAAGNAFTGSPTFTAFIAENRNVFSWHDTLEDLRQPNAEGSVPEGTALSYLVTGWYRTPKDEALASPAVKVTPKRDDKDKLLGFVIDPPGWFIETNAEIPDLTKRRSVFHGMVAHINYWGAGTYRGQILGYPGAPRKEGSIGKSTPAFKVGVGNSAEDALVSLVSSSYSGEHEAGLAPEAPNLWKALEAVVYRQPESLIRSWNASPRDNAVHQNWFSTMDAGKIWFIRPKSDNEGVFPTKPEETAAQTKIKPTDAQLAELQRLNAAQSEADAISRELGALQQELYARWWKVAGKSRDLRPNLTDEVRDVKELLTRVNNLKTSRDQALAKLGPLPDQLKAKLPKELELKYDAAPRFWSPADPVIVIKNCGCPTKHQFPRPLSCRLPEQIVNTTDVTVDRNKNSFSKPAGVAEIAAAAQQHLPACPPILGKLVDEGSIVEQAVTDLAQRTLPGGKRFDTVDDWQGWVDQLEHDLTWDGKPENYPRHQVTFDKPGVKPHSLVELWGQQPWAPLFLDWQITWFPTPDLPSTEDGFGPTWPLRNFDYLPLDKKSIPATGYTIRGRSLLSPIDGRMLTEPIDMLRGLLHGGNQGGEGKPTFPDAVVDILKRYEIVWDKTLADLKASGLMGQALTGFHQSLLRRDVTLPRVMPDPARPWIEDNKFKNLDGDVTKVLDAPDQISLTCETLAPPAPKPETETRKFSFSMVRAGALRIDELWLIDDFGQSADLLGLTPARSKSSGQVFHPRMRWHNDQKVTAMPPRVLQPTRLNFRFAAADELADKTDPALRAICGWLFFNPLDQALVLCDRGGNLLGELAITKNQTKFSIAWEPGAGGVAIDNIPNANLKKFAKSLIEADVTNPRMIELLNLIDRSLERIRPAAARNNSVLASRPLALVSATIGLELFGKAWTDPHESVPAAKASPTGDAKLDALKIRVNLGVRQNVEDGLVGYFKNEDYNRVIVGELPTTIAASTYIGAPPNDVLRVGFGQPEKITMLMDPWGSVQAACGLVPAKSITLVHPALDHTVALMETSFRVGPVLLQAGKIALPTPAGDKGTWSFDGPLTNQTATTVAALDPKYFSDQPVVATEGRLLLLNEE